MKKKLILLSMLVILHTLAVGCSFPIFTTFVSLLPDTNLSVSPDTLLQARNVLQNRLNRISSGKALVTIENNTLRVGLTKDQDLPLVIEMATQPGLLVFFHSSQPIPPGETMPSDAQIIFTGAAFQDGDVYQDSSGKWSNSISLSPEGKEKLANYTTTHVGEYLVIARDYKVISAPKVNGAITGGKASIMGSFSKESAEALAIQIRFGAMPIPLKVVK